MTQSPEIPPITPEVSLRIDGTHFTAKQLEALSLIHDGASLRGAAAQLGIAAPTLFNYIGNLEERCGFPLLERGRGKAQLTAAGREIVEQYRSWKSAVEPFDSFVVACTPLSEPFVRDALEMVARSPCDSVPSLIVADDRTNLELGKRNSAAVVIFDDPLFVQQTLGESAPRTFDAGFDRLLFCDRGDEFIRLAWGAQRLGFDWLDSQDRPYKQCGTCLTPETMEQSGKSFFLEQSVALQREIIFRDAVEREAFDKRCGLSVKNFVRGVRLEHALVGVVFRERSRSSEGEDGGLDTGQIRESIIFCAKKHGFR